MTLEQEQALILAAVRRRRAAAVLPEQGIPDTPEQAAPQAPFERAGIESLGAFGSGMAQGAIKGALGIKQLFGGLSEEDKGVLAKIEEEAAEDPSKGWRTTGDIAANVALTAVPGSKIEKALRGARALPGAARAAMSAAASSGATESVLGVGQGDTFADQLGGKLAGAAKAATIGGALGGAFQKAARFFRPSAEAVKLMDMNVTPTLQQGADSKIGKFVGGMSGGAFADAVSARQNKEVLDEAMRRIAPDVDVTNLNLSQMVTKAGDSLDQGFDRIFDGKKITLSSPDKASMWRAARRAAGNEPDVVDNVLTELGRAGQALRSNNTVTLGQGGMRKQRNMLQDRINAVGREQTTKAGDVKAGLIAAKNKFDEIVRNRQLNADEQAALISLNSRMADFKRLENMAMKPGSHAEFTAPKLLNSFATMDPSGGAGFARAENAMQRQLLEPATRLLNLSGQDDTRAGLVAMRRALPVAAAGGAGAGVAGLVSAGMPLASASLAAGYGASLLGQTKAGANLMFGNTSYQRALANILRKGVAGPTGSSLYSTQGDQE